jgi:amidase
MDLFESATRAAAMIRAREISSRELTTALLERIDAVNPGLNAITVLRREEALREADAADRTPAAGPLHGVPMTIKDGFHVAGLPTTWGNPAFRELVADADATVVGRLKRDAGAIIVGKTNVAFMLSDFGQTTNDVYGTTANPWDSSRTAGGSSGGAAAAVAAGLTFLEYGSDLAGSIRIPASLCGGYGLKPTYGVVPTTGFQPPGPLAPPRDIGQPGTVGPMARSAADLRTALRVTAGPEAPDSVAYRWQLPRPRRTRLADLRIGVVLDHEAAPVTGDVGAVLSDTVDGLARAGARIVPGWPAGVDPLRDGETFGFILRMFFAFQGGGADPTAGTLPVSDFVEHESRRIAVRAAWDRYFSDIDVFACPATFTTAFPHDDRPYDERTIGDRPYQDLAFWVPPASLPGLPAVVAPAGLTPAGLPVGLQLIGPRFEDDTAITAAELMDEVTGGYRRPDM